jgi:hypothetical protein
MSRFQDLSNNTYKPRTFNRDMSNNNFRQTNNRFKQSRAGSRFGSNLPTNSRWNRVEEPREQRNDYRGSSWKNTNRRFGNRRPYHHNNLQQQEENSKFVDLKSMSRGFDVITTKPKQNKKKKKKKRQIIEEQSLNDSKQLNKNTNKYDLTKEDQDKLNELIVNQYNYEVIEETESDEEDQEENKEEL